LKYIIFLLCSFIFNSNANGPSSLICEENCSSADPLTDFILGTLMVGAVYFGWLIWGRRSVKLIYIPVIIGCIAIVLFDVHIRSYFLFPVGGLFIGWVMIGIVMFVFKFDYFGSKYAFPPEKFIDENLPPKTPQVFQSKPVKHHLETTEAASYDRKFNPEAQEPHVKENQAVMFDVGNWSDAMLKAALLNKTYKLPMYKDTLLKIELEVAKRDFFNDVENK